MTTKRAKRSGSPHLIVDNFGPIKHADVTFGDLTVLVGPQATGKSILLQLTKLIVDLPDIKHEFSSARVDWKGKFPGFLDVYFGEGMRSLWKDSTTIEYNGEPVDLVKRVKEEPTHPKESMFYIPAQRVMAIRDGWPLAFPHYDGHPFTLRQFSENIRRFSTNFYVEGEDALSIAPQHFKFQELLQKHIFPGFELRIDTQRPQKRLILASNSKNGNSLPVAVWSSGQREFVPLVLGMYWLMSLGYASGHLGLEWVVIEEPEMGLHPRAMTVVILMIFELMSLGHRVCVSTHSPQVLEGVWALQRLKKHGADAASLLGVFDVESTPPMIELAENVMKKKVSVYYFDRNGTTRDISELDPGAEEAGESGWGGLSEFSGRANEAVASAVANSQ